MDDYHGFRPIMQRLRNDNCIVHVIMFPSSKVLWPQVLFQFLIQLQQFSILVLLMEMRILATEPCKNGVATFPQINNVLCQHLTLLWIFFKSYKKAIKESKQNNCRFYRWVIFWITKCDLKTQLGIILWTQ